MAVLRPWARLRMVLDRKHRPADDTEPLIRVVEEREVGRLDPARQALGIDDKAVILAGDFYGAGQEILDRMVGAAMTAGHLAGAAAERQRHQLMAETNPEYRFARIDQLAQHRDRIGGGRGGIARPVRQENPVGPKAKYVLRRGGGGDDGDPATVMCEHPQDVALGAVIDRDDMMPRVALPAVTASLPPAGLIPLVSLTATDLAGEIHSFETGPCRRSLTQRRNIERMPRIVGDHPVRRTPVANKPGQPPRIDTRNPDHPVRFEPGNERARGAPVRRPGHPAVDDEPARRRGGCFDILSIGPDIADMGKGEIDDLGGIRRVG